METVDSVIILVRIWDLHVAFQSINSLSFFLPLFCLFLFLSFLSLFLYLFLPSLFFPYLALPYLTLPCLALPYFALPYFALPYFALPYLYNKRNSIKLILTFNYLPHYQPSTRGSEDLPSCSSNWQRSHFNKGIFQVESLTIHSTILRWVCKAKFLAVSS